MTLGNGVTYTGASVATAGRPGAADRLDRRRPAGRRPDAARAAATAPTTAPSVLDPAKVAGKIVVCERGVTARVNKSLAVKEAGGVGMVLVNSRRQLAQRRLPLRARPCTCQTDRPRRRQGLRGDGRRDGARSTQADDRLQRAGAVHGVVLVARPAPRRRRRPAQAGPHRPRPGHPGRRRAARQRRSRLRPLQRHLDVQPARGRPRRRCSRTCTRAGRRWRSSRR